MPEKIKELLTTHPRNRNKKSRDKYGEFQDMVMTDLKYISDKIVAEDLDSKEKVTQLWEHIEKEVESHHKLSRFGRERGAKFSTNVAHYPKLALMVRDILNIINPDSNSLRVYNQIYENYNNRLNRSIEHELIHQYQCEKDMTKHEIAVRTRLMRDLNKQAKLYDEISRLREYNDDDPIEESFIFKMFDTTPEEMFNKGMSYAHIKDHIDEVKSKHKDMEKEYNAIFEKQNKLYDEKFNIEKRFSKEFELKDPKCNEFKARIDELNKQLINIEDSNKEDTLEIAEKYNTLYNNMQKLRKERRTWIKESKKRLKKNKEVNNLEKLIYKQYDEIDVKQKEWSKYLDSLKEQQPKVGTDLYVLNRAEMIGDKLDRQGITESFAWLWNSFRNGFTPQYVSKAINGLNNYRIQKTPQHKKMFVDLIALRKNIKKAKPDINDSDIMKILMPMQDGLEVQMHGNYVGNSSITNIVKDKNVFGHLLQLIDQEDDKTQIAKEMFSWMKNYKQARNIKPINSPIRPTM
jgi:hypothetical protein